MNVMDAYVQGLDDKALIELAQTNLIQSQMRFVLAEARERGLHGFAHLDESRPEACLCGAMFVVGYHLDVVKRAHLDAVSNA